MKPLDIALCYESVFPNRGGAETYISDLSRRLARDGHTVHLYASAWDSTRLPSTMVFHALPKHKGPRFLRPWRFAEAVEKALTERHHDVTVGFDKTWGQDILYPQGGLHAASQEHNRRKFPGKISRIIAGLAKKIDLANRSFAKLERKQYLGESQPMIVVNSRMVERHFGQHYGIPPERLRVVHSAIDPSRFAAPDRPERRAAERAKWGVDETTPVGLFVAMNYRLKGLAPLIQAVAAVPKEHRFKIAIVGHPKFHKYEKLAAKLGIQDRLLFLGFRADPKEAYFAADFLVHPTFYDPCSLVALEALACGLPVITTQYNGASELLNVPENGLVINDPHDATELGGAIQTMLQPGYLTSASRSALEAANRWTFEQHYAALLACFHEVAARKERGQ
ncbi:MAG: glycosyltransferase family 4 protein [Fimbriiglobus sp.]